MSGPTKSLASLAREPLVHFALLGAVIFGAHHALSPDAPEAPERVIRLDERYLDALVQREVVGGAPHDREAVAARWIRDEALAAEAQRLGLDAHDPILRRRLVQKMELWLEAHVEVEPPTDAELEDALAAHPERYRREARLTFEHVFFASARADPEADARDGRARVEGGEAPEGLGDPFLLGRRLEGRTAAELEERFGATFARALEAAEPRTWTEPIQSAYGWHVVRLIERVEGGLPPIADVRERVRRDVLLERREAAVRRAQTELVQRYRVIREPPDVPVRYGREHPP